MICNLGLIFLSKSQIIIVSIILLSSFI